LTVWLAAVVGCQSSASVGKNQLVVRELRLQEDRIYELEDAVEHYEMEVAALERENETLKQERTRGDHGDSLEKKREPKRSILPSPSKLFQKPPEKELTPPPEVDFGSGADATHSRRGPQKPLSLSGLLKSSQVVPADHEVAEPEDPNVYDIAFNTRLTGALPREAFNGRGGVMVVLEPHNEQGELVGPQGDISIVVMDPAETGKSQRIARWDFTSRQALRYYKKTPLGTGYHFELPWSGHPPTHADLHLFVRLATPRGDDLTIDTPLQLTNSKSKANVQRAEFAQQEDAEGEGSNRVARGKSPMEILQQLKEAVGPDKAPSADEAFDNKAAGETEPQAEEVPRTVEKPVRTARSKPAWRPER
jgi:hypothetical protein